MSYSNSQRWLAGFLALALSWAPIPALAEDIDIFTGGTIAGTNPSILFVLDNTANWSGNDQQFPNEKQGQAEVAAIKEFINDASVVDAGVNIGLMEINTVSNAPDGGALRFAIKPMTAVNKAALSAQLDIIYPNVEANDEKRNAQPRYGVLLQDVRNYLTGSDALVNLNPPINFADTTGYNPAYSRYQSPITAANSCGRIFMVFIGNPNSNGPTDDYKLPSDTGNLDALTALSCNTNSIGLPNFTSATATQQASLGTTQAASEADCVAWANAQKAGGSATYSTYDSFSCVLANSGTISTLKRTSNCGEYASAAACQAANPGDTCTATAVACTNVALGTSVCGQYASAAACQAAISTAHPGFTSQSCVVDATNPCGGGTSVLGTTNCGEYTTVAKCQAAAPSRWPGFASYACDTETNCSSPDVDGGACYTSNSTATCKSAIEASYPAGTGYTVTCSNAVESCPASVTVCGDNNTYNNATKCNAGGTANLPGYPVYTCTAAPVAASVCADKYKWTITGKKYAFTAAGAGKTYRVTGTSAAGGTSYIMSGSGGSRYEISGTSTWNTYNVFGNYSVATYVPTGTYSTTANKWLADEWARCLYQQDLSPDGTPGVKEVFRADFSASGPIDGDDTITFDGVTVTIPGSSTPIQTATIVQQGAYPNWDTVHDPATAVVTFAHKNVGAIADVTAGSFVIVNQNGSAGQPVVSVTTTQQGTDAIGGASGKQNVTTYTIDVFNAKPNADHTGLLMSMAQQGGGRYFAAKSRADILTALKKIISEIQSVNTAFAAASIPLSTTNRSQNLNEVYIGVFRPSLEPRWFGNLKKFQIAKTGSGLDLVDATSIVNPQTLVATSYTSALNPLTGFLNDCATSFWTTDSGAWWDQVKIGALDLASNTLLSPVPQSTCKAMPAGNTSTWSDLPDGQSVEKGAVAEVIRRGNNPPTTGTPAGATWQVNRSIYTRSGNVLVPLDSAAVSAATGLAGASATNLYDYIRGVDINISGSHVWEKAPITNTSDPNYVAALAAAYAAGNAVRPSVHGDVVHSRPMAVNFGTNKTAIFYGANDGMLRAVDGATGREIWSFLPPEFLSSAQTRLMQNTPPIAYGATPAVGSTPKNYLFDGSPGLLQSANNTAVWLYPTQRRGGRMVYGLDVTALNNPTPPYTPSLKWYQGCPSLTNDVGCTTGFSDIGQTWSVPVVTKIKNGTSDTGTRVVVFGGGYDTCEDVKPTTNPPTWSCGSAKGRGVYLVDADTGNLIAQLTTAGMRSVTAGISFVDINNDGIQDYAYVVDLGGAIYRISFVDSPSAVTALDAAQWTIKKVAYASGGRKLMFAPAVLYAGEGNVYLATASGDRERPLLTDYPYEMTVPNYVYVYRDSLNGATESVTACHLDDVTDGGCTYDNTPIDSTPIACDTDRNLAFSTAKKAWRVAMANRGEQAVTQPIILGGMVAVNTTRPVNAGACSAALGEGAGYFLNLTTGSGAIGVTGTCGGAIRGVFQGIGLPTDPVVVNLPGQPPICIGCVDRRDPFKPSKLFEPTPVPPPLSKTKFRKYRFMAID